jgi:N-methylhydantoinase A
MSTKDRKSRVRLSSDIGGTFTDIVMERDGERLTSKVLTTPGEPERAVIDGTLSLLAEHEISPSDVDLFIHGTTLATNAIIERKGALTAVIGTEGFRDTLDIADEGRFDQYDIFIDKPAALIPRSRRFTVIERVNARGDVVLPLDDKSVHALAPELRRMGIKSVAVALLHSYANPQHEQRVREILAEQCPGIAVTLSYEVCPEVREYERTSTAVANAYVQPLMAGYLHRLGKELVTRGFDCPVYLMTSGGGLTTLETAARFPIRLVESGPAGGAILASYVAAQCDEHKVVSFDMGGTTAKICLIEDQKPQSSRTFEVDRAARFLRGSGLPLRIPVIEMIEIGAGGGSIAHVDALKRIAVGPESAGSEPGPACYGRGGEEPTVTDSNLCIGRIDPDRFAGGKMKLYPDRSAAALTRAIGQKLDLSVHHSAYGVLEMVDENMANAARVHSVERGKDIATHTMIAFGGAAPLHAARLAEKLGMRRVIIPANAGVGSAVGFLRAPIAFEVVRSRYMTLSTFDAGQANRLIDQMRQEASAVVRAGAGDSELVEVCEAFMRYKGQGHEIVVRVPARELTAGDAESLRDAFEKEYIALFSRAIPHAIVEILTWTFSVSTIAEKPDITRRGPVTATEATPVGARTLFDPDSDKSITVRVYAREQMEVGNTLTGPAIIAEYETTTFVPATFSASVNDRLCIVLEKSVSQGESR